MKKTIIKLIASVTTACMIAAMPLTALAGPASASFLKNNRITTGDIKDTKNLILRPFIGSNILPSEDDLEKEAEMKEYYNQRVQQLENMKKEKVNISIHHRGAYVAKTSTLYALRITGVNPDGSFIYGGWETIDNRSGVCVGNDKTITLSGDYVGFAYALDIRWGTDWPYNDTFWNDAEHPAKNIDIRYGGTCRMVSIKIDVDGQTVVNDGNCSSHK